jgi:hypothetical protein
MIKVYIAEVSISNLEAECSITLASYSYRLITQFYKISYHEVKKKQSRYTPWWRFGGRGDIALTHS